MKRVCYLILLIVVITYGCESQPDNTKILGVGKVDKSIKYDHAYVFDTTVLQISTKVCELNNGDRVQIIGGEGEYLKIRKSNNTSCQGYVYRDLLAEVSWGVKE